MSAGEIHINDVGTSFEVTLKDQSGNAVNLTAASVKTFIFDKPDGVNVEKTPVFITDGADGKLRYIALTGDIDQIGLWRLQAYVEIPAGKFFSDITEFRVYPNL